MRSDTRGNVCCAQLLDSIRDRFCFQNAKAHTWCNTLGRGADSASGLKSGHYDGELEHKLDSKWHPCDNAVTYKPVFEYPALYRAAGDASAAAQSIYLNLLRCEYFFLFIASILALDFSDSPIYFVAYGLLFIAAAVTLLYRSSTKPEQTWYKGRALAESIKTSTWRYCMRAAPFEDAVNVKIPRGEFRNLLRSVLESNHHIGERMPPGSAADDQITLSMEATRELDLHERKEVYAQHRIREQRTWYQMKSGVNRRNGRGWVSACVIVYAFATASVLLRIAYPDWKMWPTEPLIVAASTIVGWIQIKRFTELASAYALTAHEIGIVQGMISEIETETAFSAFVNEAELAFSREHTQWVARQQYL